jgi:Lon protease-like protein
VLLATGTQRFRVTGWLQEDPHPAALVEDISLASSVGTGEGHLDRNVGRGDVAVDRDLDGVDGVDSVGVLVERAHSTMRRTLALLSELGESRPLTFELEHGSDADQTAWRLCALAPVSSFDLQRLLEIDDPRGRLHLLINLAEARADDARRLLSGGLSPEG